MVPRARFRAYWTDLPGKEKKMILEARILGERYTVMFQYCEVLLILISMRHNIVFLKIKQTTIVIASYKIT